MIRVTDPVAATDMTDMTDPRIQPAAAESSAGWTFLTNHSHVLICLARDPRLRLRDLAQAVGITERAVNTIINDLEAAGCLERNRVGRRNHYRIVPGIPMRHRVERNRSLSDLLDVMVPEDRAERRR